MTDPFAYAIPYDERQRPIKATIQDDMLLITLADGRLIGTPLAWYPRLLNASPEQRANVELSSFAVHWPDIDEDLGIEGMLLGIQPPTPKEEVKP